jgi:hypothetical protein
MQEYNVYFGDFASQNADRQTLIRQREKDSLHAAKRAFARYPGYQHHPCYQREKEAGIFEFKVVNNEGVSVIYRGTREKIEPPETIYLPSGKEFTVHFRSKVERV